MPSNAHTNEHPESGKYENCFVAFLDILGFKTKVLDSQNNEDTLENIIQSLKIVSSIPSGGKKASSGSGSTRTIQIRSRFFSDTLVFFIKEKKEDIAQLFFVIRYLQDQLWERGICLRGSIVLGKMYWTKKDENVTVGPGIIDAHHQESTIAIYPRIVVSEKLYKYIEHESPEAFPFGNDENGEATSLLEYIAQDADGIRFLDLLHPYLVRARDEKLERHGDDGFSIVWSGDLSSKHSQVLDFVDNIIEEYASAKDEKVIQKYAWLKTYRRKKLWIS